MPTVHRGSILEAQTAVIVNPANSFLRHGGGLAKVIADAAAPKNVWANGWDSQKVRDAIGKAWWDEQFAHESIPTGGAAVTSSGHLPFQAIIHAVGPIWGGGTYCERELLARCIRSVGDICYVAGYLSVAVPAISCGLFRFPVNEAAGIMVRQAAVLEDNYPVRFAFYVMGDEHGEAFEAAL